jgi:putative ABC transport system permease protein
VGATLVARSVWQLSRVDPGFDFSRVAVLALHPSASRYPEASQRRAFYAAVTERLATTPGVTSVGAAQLLPLGDSNWETTYSAAEQAVADDAVLPRANLRIVTPGYFGTIGVPIVEGRDLTGFDGDESPAVAVINQRLARLLGPTGPATGRQLRMGSEIVTVVGVVSDVRQQQLDLEPLPTVYRAHGQRPLTDMFVFASVTGDPNSQFPALRAAVWSVDDQVPITDERSLESVVVASVGQPRFLANVLLTFAVAALLLGMVGVYGVMSHTVGQQLPDIAVRMALGATRGVVIKAILSHAFLMVGIGLMVGTAAALGATRVLSGVLFEVSPTDPATFVGVAVLLSLAAGLAAFMPAQRATRVDPATTLRTD